MKDLLNKVVEVHSYLLSESGYPIYDLLENYNYGQVHFDNLIFYTEDEDLLNHLRKVDSKVEYLKSIYEEKKSNFYKKSDFCKNHKIMSPKETYAFINLQNKEVFENTLLNKLSGSAILVKNNEVLIFNSKEIQEINKSNIYFSFEKEMLDLNNKYEHGLKPQIIFKDKAALKIIKMLKDFHSQYLTNFSEVDKENLNIIKLFIRDVLKQKYNLNLVNKKVFFNHNGFDYIINLNNINIIFNDKIYNKVQYLIQDMYQMILENNLKKFNEELNTVEY